MLRKNNLKAIAEMTTDLTCNSGSVGQELRATTRSFKPIFGCALIVMLWFFNFVPSAPLEAQQPNFRIKTLQGASFTSNLSSIDQNGVLTGSKIEQSLSIADVLSIVQADFPFERQDTSPVQVVLNHGGEIHCEKVSVDDSQLFAETGVEGLKEFPLDVVEAIIFSPSQTAQQALLDRSTDKDTIVVQTASGLKMVSGVFEGLIGGKVELNFKGKSRKIDLGKVTAIILADLKPVQPQGSMTTIELINGSRLHGAIEGLSDGLLSIRLTRDATVSVPLKTVKRLDVVSDNLVYLSSLPPLSVEQQTIFALQRKWQADLSVEENPLTLMFKSPDGTPESKTYEKGIGIQSWSRIEFGNQNQYTRFQATVGIDAETRGRGDCIAEVATNGITLWSQRIRGSDNPVEVDVDISDIASIELIVKPGAQFDLADHVDWADARFVKTN